MSLLVTTRGLGKRGGFLATRGLGRGIFEVLSPAGDSGKFYDMRDDTDQIHREDEELITISRGLVEICNRLH